MIKRSSDKKIILVKRRTRLQELVFKHNTAEQAEFYVNSRGEDFSDYLDEDITYRQSLAEVETKLCSLGRVQVLDREFLANFIFDKQDIIVVIGQDGLVANTLKYLLGQPTIAINPDPRRFDGILLPFSVQDTELVVGDVIRGKQTNKTVMMASATLNDGQSMVAVNDFFIGQRSHTSARYQISLDEQSEYQSSSGIIVSTGLGSTGWLKSVLTGTLGIARANKWAQSDTITPQGFNWDKPQLVYSVREPFPSQQTGTEMLYGTINSNTPLHLASAMPENGVIFSDGMIDDFIEFNTGATVDITLSKTPGQLVI
jgi:NAD kinase